MFERFSAFEKTPVGVVDWKFDDNGHGWFEIDNEGIAEPEWKEEIYVLNGYDSQPVPLGRIVEEDLGLKVEPYQRGDGE